MASDLGLHCAAGGVLSGSYVPQKDLHICKIHQGPVSSNHLRRIFVFKMSKDIFNLIRKTEEGRKLSHDAKRIRSVNLNMAISLPFLLLIFFSVCLFAYFLCFNSNKCELNSS